MCTAPGRRDSSADSRPTSLVFSAPIISAMAARTSSASVTPMCAAPSGLHSSVIPIASHGQQASRHLCPVSMTLSHDPDADLQWVQVSET